MVKVFIETDSGGNIVTSATSKPLVQHPNEVYPNFNCELELTWEQIDNLYNYRIVDNQLVPK